MPKKNGSRTSARAASTRAVGRTTPARRSRRAAARGGAAPGTTAVQTWPTDPMGGLPPLQVPAPALPGSPLASRIVDPAHAPAAQVHPVGTAAFRYWNAAAVLRRCAAFWNASGVTAWNGAVGASLPVRLDDGVDLNAYYARNDFPPQDVKQGLSFFHATVRDVVNRRDVEVFSGESGDVAAHEMGHAVLDALKPALFEVASIEAAAFHESFGDMSAVLTALQLPTVRQSVLEETHGNLRRNSSVSRVAEQLGWAIRQQSPSAVDTDSLRNAANAFLYVDPLTLPASGPASQLTRAPHNFSRVFTGAFLEALAGMVTTLASEPDVAAVLQASADMGTLLSDAVKRAPVSTKFFQSVAEQMIVADGALFGGRYARALTAALVRRNLLPVRSLAAPESVAAPAAAAAVAAARHAATAAGRGLARGSASDAPVRIAIDGAAMGLAAKTLYAAAPPVDDADAAPATTMAGITARATGGAPRTTDVQAFCESLIVRGRVFMGDPTATRAGGRRRGLVAAFSEGRKHATHYLAPGPDDSMELKRITFECC